MRVTAGRGKDGRIRVWFRGELRLLLDLTKERGLIPGVVNASWHRAGEPDILTEAFFDGVRERMRNPAKAKHYRVDGVRYSAQEMVREFGVNQSTLDNRREVHGKTDYTRAELAEMLRHKEERSAKINKKWGRGTSVPPPIDDGWTLEQRALARFQL